MDEGKPVAQDDGRVLSVKLKPLLPGSYSVEWHVTSVDTHKTEGHFTFTVKSRYYGATATDLSIQHAKTRPYGHRIISSATQPPTY